MKKFRKVWTSEINEWLKTTKGMTPKEAYTLFLKTYPENTDVTYVAFKNQRSRMKASGLCTNLNFSRKPRPLFSEQVKKGYIRIKVAQPNVWISKAKYVYMLAHPEEDLTERSNYVFLDGNNRNFDPTNIERVQIKYMGLFNGLGGTETGRPDITKLRILQAQLKYAILDKGEEIGEVVQVGTSRRFKEDVNRKAREYRMKPGVRERQNANARASAKRRIEKLKVEGGESWKHYLELKRKAGREYARRKRDGHRNLQSDK